MKILPAGSLLLVIAILSGCVSPKYRMDPGHAAQPPPLHLTAGPASELEAAVNTVIVYHGPGSWKHEAYWDEYVISLTNRSTMPVTVESALLADLQGQAVTASGNPWEIEKASKTWWQNVRYGDGGRLLVLGGGAAASGALGLAVAEASLMVGAPAGFAAAATVAAAALPVYAVATVVRNVKSRHQVEAEFGRRKLALPLTLVAGQNSQGSLFFRITPGPQRLTLRVHDENGARDLVIDLGPLADLHLKSQPLTASPRPAEVSDPSYNQLMLGDRYLNSPW